MTDNNTSQPAPTNSTKSQHCRKRHPRGAFFIIGVLSVGALLGAFGTKAFSHGHGWHGHGWHGPHGMMWEGMNGNIDPAVVEKRAERMAKHFSIAIDATPVQTDKLVTIAKALALDMAPLRKELRDTRHKAVDMLTSDNINEQALEELRSQQITRFDAASKRLLQAATKAAEILTSQQKQELQQRIKNWREARAHWGWGWHKPESSQ